MAKKIMNPNIANTFQEYPLVYRKKLLQLRNLIFKTAEKISQIDHLVETLKWGEPSYLPNRPKVGTTVRIHWIKSKPDQYGIYFHCQTNLIGTFKKKYGTKFNYEGNRAIIFKRNDQLPLKELQECIMMALSHHL